MGQVLVPDKISDLNITGAKTAELPSSILTIGGQQYRNSTALSLDLATTGEGGLDTGSVAASTTYYIYAVRGASDTVLVASLDPDTTGPTGYSAWKLVGALETDASTDIDYLYETDEGEPQKDVEGKQTRQDEIESQNRQVNNLIINGAFDLWQRGTARLGETLGDVFYLADRMYCEPRGNNAILDFERDTDVPNNNFKYSFKITGAQTDPNDNDIAYVGQRIEADNIRPYIGKTMTFSVWTKGSFTGASTSAVLQVSTPQLGTDTWDQTNSFQNINIVAQHSFIMPNGWTRKYLTFVVPPEAADGLQVTLRTSESGSLDQNDTMFTTGWMLHEGTRPVDFQRAGRNINEEILTCMRYFQFMTSNDNSSAWGNVFVGRAIDGNTLRGCIQLPVPLRTNGTPTWSETGTATLTGANSAEFVRIDTNGSVVSSSITVDSPIDPFPSKASGGSSIGATIYRLRFSVDGSPFTTGAYYMAKENWGSTMHIDAEL